MFLASQSSTFYFQQVWILHVCGQHGVSFFHLVGFSYLPKNPSRIWLRILSKVLEEKLKFLDLVLWLNNYYYCLADFPPLFLDFLTLRIKFALWNSGKAWEAKFFLQTRNGGGGGAQGVLFLGRPPRILLHFYLSFRCGFLAPARHFYLHI